MNHQEPLPAVLVAPEAPRSLTSLRTFGAAHINKMVAAVAAGWVVGKIHF